MSDNEKSDVPKDRLTRVCDAMLSAFADNPETVDGDRAIVFIIDVNKRGGIGLRGYGDDSEALADLFVHMRAIFRANGKDMHILPIGMTPPGDQS